MVGLKCLVPEGSSSPRRRNPKKAEHAIAHATNLSRQDVSRTAFILQRMVGVIGSLTSGRLFHPPRSLDLLMPA